MRFLLCITAVTVFTAMAASAPIPTFEQLDKELTKYKPKADLVGDTNAQLQKDSLAFYCIFDMFLTAVNDPKNPNHEETCKAWDHNYDVFQKQAGVVTGVMGKNLLPLLITTSDQFANDFKKGSRWITPRFNPDDYLHPLSVETTVNGKNGRVAWWHGAADADGDKKSNADELLAVASEWQKRGVSEAVRLRFFREAVGIEPWFTKTQDGIVSAKNKSVAEEKR